MTLRGPLLILGFGGHARSVGDVALAAGFERLVFFDEHAGDGEAFEGHRAQSTLPAPGEDRWQAFPAAGDNARRERQCHDAPHPLATLVAPGATIGIGASLGEGTFVARHAHVGPLARIGRGVILNTGCVVEHECAVGDFAHISVNATVAGRARIGRRVMLGAGAVVIDRVSICDDVVVGAGAVVVSDIATPGTYVGIPARPLTLHPAPAGR